MKSPKVFISYSWENPINERSVVDLAERLRKDGCDVVFDKWDLKPGTDKYEFMEQMVTNPDIQKVLLILDKSYAEKSNSRKGGVGHETMIVSRKVYEKADQTKFIPVILEVDEDGKPYTPVYLSSRIYIDLSSVQIYEEGYEKILRDIFGKPEYKKPKIGEAPKYLFESESSTSSTAGLIHSFLHELSKSPNAINSLSRNFLMKIADEIVATDQIDIDSDAKALGYIEYTISSLIPVRDVYINFLKVATEIDRVCELNPDEIIHFFESICRKHELTERAYRSNPTFLALKFIVRDLFLYTIASCIQNDNYRMISILLQSRYYIGDRKEDKVQFVYFSETLYELCSVFASEKNINTMFPAHEYTQSNLSNLLTIESIATAEVMLFIVSEMNDYPFAWYPVIPKTFSGRSIPLFYRLESKRHFEKVKCVFDIDSPDDLSKKFIEAREKIETNRGGDHYLRRILFSYPNLFQVVNIASEP